VTGFGVVGHHGVIVGKAQRNPEALQVRPQGLHPGPGHDALDRLTEKDVVKVEERTLWLRFRFWLWFRFRLRFWLWLWFRLWRNFSLEGQLETGV
jgi:hypothetical protein